MCSSPNNAYSLLRKKIILGEYPPGQRLKEQSLAAALGVSRSPIRLAFQRLVDEGLLIAQKNCGVAVAPWTDKDNDEVFDLRALGESHAASLAAQRRQSDHLAMLHQLNDNMASLIAKRPTDFLTDLQQVNRQFHETILQAASSPRLTQFIQSLLSVERVAGAFFYYSAEELENSLIDHRNITRAIELQDITLARALVDAHIRGTSNRLKRQRQALLPT